MNKGQTVLPPSLTSRVTVVVPCFNAERFLEDCLRSVLDQTLPVDEVIIVDDCSTDDSAKIATSFAGEYRNVRLLRTAVNSGSAVARNVGLHAASNEFVALIDADDVWLPIHCATVLALLERHPECALAFSKTQVTGTERWEWKMRVPEGMPVNCFWESLSAPLVPQNSVIMRRSIVLGLGGYREDFRLAQDFDLWLRLAYRHPFICTHNSTTIYRTYIGSASTGRITKSRAAWIRSRFLFREEVHAHEQPEFLNKLDMIMRQLWLDAMEDCCKRLDYAGLELLLQQHNCVPDSGRPYRKWRIKRALLPLYNHWRHVPEGVRRAVASLLS